MKKIRKRSEPVKAAFYLRSATENVADLSSQRELMTQKFKCYRSAKYEIFYYCDKCQSGFQEGPDFSRLKNDILEKKINMVIVSRMDRVSRDHIARVTFLNFLKKHNIRLVDISKNAVSVKRGLSQFQKNLRKVILKYNRK